jgi:hypothetical protein
LADRGLVKNITENISINPSSSQSHRTIISSTKNLSSSSTLHYTSSSPSTSTSTLPSSSVNQASDTKNIVTVVVINTVLPDKKKFNKN